MIIRGWDRKMCDNCRRVRVHYKRNDNRWYCMGTMQSALDVVAKCGDPVKQPEEIRDAADRKHTETVG